LKLLWRAFEVGAPSALAEYLHLQQSGPARNLHLRCAAALSCGCGDPGEGTTPEGPSGSRFNAWHAAAARKESADRYSANVLPVIH
jgi:hypothetical protein